MVPPSSPLPDLTDPRPLPSPPVAARAEGQPEEPLRIPIKWPRLLAFGRALQQFFVNLWAPFARYFRHRDPTFGVALAPFLFLTSVLYLRDPRTNYIFDEQEALLANPYVNQVGFKYEDAIYRDFWGLPPNASIGSYRPIPNYLWRGLVELGERAQPWFDYVIAHPIVGLCGVAFIVFAIVGLIVRGFGTGLKGLLLTLAITGVLLGVGVEIILLSLPRIVHFLFADLPPVGPLTEVARRSFFQHIYNIIFHAINGAIFTAMAWAITRRRLLAWLVGTTFVTCALLTEAVSGCVGLADVLGGMGALCALASLGLPAYAMPFGVFLSVLFAFFSKESAIVCVPLVPFAALVAAPVIHPDKPARVPRAVLAAIGSITAFVIYVEMRKRWFPSPLPSELQEPLSETATKSQELVRDFLVWFHQAPLPRDPLNNPFADAKVDTDHRIAGALRVYDRGLWQVVFPQTLSGDYSYPQEPAPNKLVFAGSVWGAIFTIVPLCASMALWVLAIVREAVGLRRGSSADDGREPDPPREPRRWRRGFTQGLHHGFAFALIAGSWLLVHHMLHTAPAKDAEEQIAKNIAIPIPFLQKYIPVLGLACFAIGAIVEAMWKKRPRIGGLWRLAVLAVGLLWLVVSYFPHSNVPVLLPTVRAERLWYFPVIGTTMVVATTLDWIHESLVKLKWPRLAIVAPVLFLGFQAFHAYWHAMDYRSDLLFWEATKDSVPHSAKAHLNYSVMVGAHNTDYKTRLEHSLRAIKLAPDWAMARIYTGDTLCRMGRAQEAWPYYKVGFEKGPADKGLISLALQCMWDQKILKPHDDELRQLATDNPSSWLAYLAVDTLDNGDKYGGVNPEYRPRSYNEGPAKKKTSATTEDSESATESGSEVADDSSGVADLDSASASAHPTVKKARTTWGSATTSGSATATHSAN